MDFPNGRSAVGDMATKALKIAMGPDCVLNMTKRMYTGRSYYCDKFDEKSARQALLMMDALGFNVTANQHRYITLRDERCNWTLHVDVGDKAVETARRWRAGQIKLVEIVADYFK